MLGFLQLDSAGNLNLSNRGPRVLDYVGPGGAAEHHRIGQHRAVHRQVDAGRQRSAFRVGERLRLDTPGKPKLVEQVDEVTFNGSVALAQRQERSFTSRTLQCSSLTDDGLTLRAVMPGIDIERDLLANSRARIRRTRRPRGPETVAAAVVTRRRTFNLDWAENATNEWWRPHCTRVASPTAWSFSSRCAVGTSPPSSKARKTWASVSSMCATRPRPCLPPTRLPELQAYPALLRSQPAQAPPTRSRP